jgi:hypothetical protein
LYYQKAIEAPGEKRNSESCGNDIYILILNKEDGYLPQRFFLAGSKILTLKLLDNLEIIVEI